MGVQRTVAVLARRRDADWHLDFPIAQCFRPGALERSATWQIAGLTSTIVQFSGVSSAMLTDEQVRRIWSAAQEFRKNNLSSRCSSVDADTLKALIGEVQASTRGALGGMSECELQVIAAMSVFGPEMPAGIPPAEMRDELIGIVTKDAGGLQGASEDLDKLRDLIVAYGAGKWRKELEKLAEIEVERANIKRELDDRKNQFTNREDGRELAEIERELADRKGRLTVDGWEDRWVPAVDWITYHVGSWTSSVAGWLRRRLPGGALEDDYRDLPAEERKVARTKEEKARAEELARSLFLGHCRCSMASERLRDAGKVSKVCRLQHRLTAWDPSKMPLENFISQAVVGAAFLSKKLFGGGIRAGMFFPRLYEDFGVRYGYVIGWRCSEVTVNLKRDGSRKEKPHWSYTFGECVKCTQAGRASAFNLSKHQASRERRFVILDAYTMKKFWHCKCKDCGNYYPARDMRILVCPLCKRPPTVRGRPANLWMFIPRKSQNPDSSEVADDPDIEPSSRWGTRAGKVALSEKDQRWESALNLRLIIDGLEAEEQLTPRQARIVRMVYLKDLPLDEIAAKLELAPSIVSQELRTADIVIKDVYERERKDQRETESDQ